MRRMKCDSEGCHLRGINLIYTQDNELVGKYCDECYSHLKTHYKNMVIKRYPKENHNITLIQEAIPNAA